MYGTGSKGALRGWERPDLSEDTMTLHDLQVIFAVLSLAYVGITLIGLVIWRPR